MLKFPEIRRKLHTHTHTHFSFWQAKKYAGDTSVIRGKGLIQLGRSMIEMLGVLAIVGLLSIGGLVMYQRSMNNHKANSIFDDVNRFQFIIEENLDQLPEGDIDKRDFAPASGFVINGYNIPTEGVYSIDVQDVPKAVCEVLLEKGEETYTMYANNILYEGSSDICLGSNEMHFYYGNTEGLCSVPGEGDEECGDGCLCQEEAGHLCLDDIRRNAYPDVPEQEKCCPSDKVNCGNHCVKPCASVLVFDRQCQCVCPDPLRIFDVETRKCVCRTDLSGIELLEDSTGNCTCPSDKPNYYGKEQGGPLCCPDKYVPFRGQCTLLECSGGTTGQTYKCKMNNTLCGTSCNSDGTSCKRGVCSEYECPGGTTMGRLPNSFFLGGGERYACLVKDRTDCAYLPSGTGYCWNASDTSKSPCCTTSKNSFECSYGTCTPSLCTALSTDDYTVTYSRANLVARAEGSCWFTFKNSDDLIVQCYPNGSSWICIQKEGENSIYCEGSCTNPPYCGGKCGVAATCPSGTTLTDNKYCCKIIDNKTVCLGLGSRRNYFKTNSGYEACGEGTAGTCNMTTGYCSVGSCTEGSAKCPNGWTYGAVGSNFYGCIKGKYKCYRVNSSFTCSYDGKDCGKECTSQVGGCGQIYRQECADAFTGQAEEMYYYLDDNEDAVSVATCPTGKTCYSKLNCLYGSAVTARCICDTDPSANVGEVCCSRGQIAVNGACVVSQ